MPLTANWGYRRGRGDIGRGGGDSLIVGASAASLNTVEDRRHGDEGVGTKPGGVAGQPRRHHPPAVRQRGAARLRAQRRQRRRQRAALPADQIELRTFAGCAADEQAFHAFIGQEIHQLGTTSRLTVWVPGSAASPWPGDTPSRELRF